MCECIISTEDAQHVLFIVGDFGLGVEPPRLRVRLINGIRRALSGDEAKSVASRHPGIVRALQMTRTNESLERLRTLVKDRLDSEAVAAA
ncbi:hypothetical protein SCB71_06495 [Herbiconiux sp. KACC 21604]|uniref:hypothetical protein n=1 Tax=unclassified Herbiconiux TaxID=2618217 RepID=UPI001491480D|nr:hypothetical protein [Herbiconiux sp. SALV-R1]QJU52963.1 hypothetical protein HL652_04475 [Herbiconiux sp. SALV-R1]WPO87888.1 hypothetical protein SCB71_06495 [Herbiconiux sp. KACC 21604]